MTAPPEIVHRPDPGLARGLWEASPSSLYVALLVVVLCALLYLSFRRGMFRRRRPPAPRDSSP
jgi:hypothetical protein